MTIVMAMALAAAPAWAGQPSPEKAKTAAGEQFDLSTPGIGGVSDKPVEDKLKGWTDQHGFARLCRRPPAPCSNETTAEAIPPAEPWENYLNRGLYPNAFRWAGVLGFSTDRVEPPTPPHRVRGSVESLATDLGKLIGPVAGAKKGWEYGGIPGIIAGAFIGYVVYPITNGIGGRIVDNVIAKQRNLERR